MKTFIITLAISLFYLSLTTNAQCFTLKGQVVDNDSIPLIGASIYVVGTTNGTLADIDGQFQIMVCPGDTLKFKYMGYENMEIAIGIDSFLIVVMEMSSTIIDEIVVVSYKPTPIREFSNASQAKGISQKGKRKKSKNECRKMYEYHNTESYAIVDENIVKNVWKSPLSTFSIDVDVASYSNVRRFINQGHLPPKDAVRIEEMINYFNYNYPEPINDDPVSIHSELGACPWDSNKLLLKLALQAKKITHEQCAPSNLVFLIDVSGSMQAPEKLPLLKSSFKLLVEQLREEDRVAIVVYAGFSGLVLNSTSCSEKHKINEAIDNLTSGGSTAGGEGLKLAYKIANDSFIAGGNNRIILATDGDFNVGPSSDGEMKRLIELNRESGVYISVLGFGMGNYKDSKMEIIADHGNGNYAYIDNLNEAKKVLVSELSSTLHALAKDVKLQIEFNPATVESYRLIGYENRLLNNEDFEDDSKDAGEIGYGHSVTAFYEIELTSSKRKNKSLKYRKSKLTNQALRSDEIAQLQIRYKQPDQGKSQLMTHVISNEVRMADSLSMGFKFSSAVAQFSMLLRKSSYANDLSYDSVIGQIEQNLGEDKYGYKSELLSLVQKAKALASK